MPRPHPAVLTLAVALFATLAVALFAGPVGRAEAQSAAPSSGTALSDAHRPQLDRIEAKLDAILLRLGENTDTLDIPPSEVADPADAPGPASTSAPGAASPAGTSGTETTGPGAGDAPEPAAADRGLDAESYRPGAIAVAHAAPSRGQPLSEIPADSIGGFVYTGGRVRLSDLSDRGVRYAGPAGIELQGWLKATEAGRHQIAADFQVRFGKGAISALPCTVSLWIEDQAIGTETRTAEPWNAGGESITLSVVLGVELQPGLYKLRLWIACAAPSPARDGESVQIELLLKTPGEMNLRPMSGEDMLHRPG